VIYPNKVTETSILFSTTPQLVSKMVYYVDCEYNEYNGKTLSTMFPRMCYCPITLCSLQTGNRWI